MTKIGTGEGSQPHAHAVRVGVVDSGWNIRCLDDRIEAGRCFIADDGSLLEQPSADYHDRIGHGTQCTRAILALAGSVSVVPLRVFGNTHETSTDVLYAALEWAATQQFSVLNMSLSTFRPDARERLYWAIERICRQGTLVVASGHDGHGGGYPAIYDIVVSVEVARAEMRRAPGVVPADLVLAPTTVMNLTAGKMGGPTNSLATACVAGLAVRLVRERGALGVDEARRVLAERLKEADAWASRFRL